MFSLRSSTVSSLVVLATAIWNPVPPCAIPPGIIGAPKNESMCFHTIVPTPKTNTISIRQIGLPYNETLVTFSFSSSFGWAQALGTPVVEDSMHIYYNDSTPPLQIYIPRLHGSADPSVF